VFSKWRPGVGNGDTMLGCRLKMGELGYRDGGDIKGVAAEA